MAILLFLIPISLLLLGVAIWAFVWSVRGGQYDDLDTAPLDILRDDPPPQAPPAAPLADDTATDGKPRADDADLLARPARDRKSTRLNASHYCASLMPSSA